MTTEAISLARVRSPVQLMISDWVTLSWRNLVAYLRIPEQVFFSTVQPVMFILLFRYVFGGAIPIPHINYVDYLMSGVFAQTVAFGSISTAIGLADDLGKGLIERFRSLPMSPSAVLVGRTTTDLLRNVAVVLLMAAVGFVVGFRVHTNALMFLAGIGILLLLAYALAWGFAVIGLSAPNAETAQLMAFPILLPLTFASSAFVPVVSMPGWLQVWARNQPISVVIDTSRTLMIGHNTMAQAFGQWPSTGSLVLKSLAWCIGILVVLAPFSAWRFRQTRVA